MLRLFILISLFLPGLGFAQSKSSLYQIDLILFTHQQTSLNQSDNTQTRVVELSAQRAFQLPSRISNAITPFHLLPVSSSQLRNEYWVLNRKASYQVLGHYSWLQPKNSQQAVIFPLDNSHGWNIEGSFRVKHNTYYQLDTTLLFSSQNNNQVSFQFTQKQRLKAGIVYYLDHPQAGMLIKIHQVT